MKTFKRIIAISLTLALIFCNLSFLTMAEDQSDEQPIAKTPAEYVDTTFGNGSGSTINGPTMPNGAIHPAVNTTSPNRGGVKPGQPVVGFAQMHVQGTGGTYSYGNFMLSPQTGDTIITDENSRASAISNEVAQAHYYSATLDKYGVQTEITADEHTAIYRITYPAGSKASLLFDASRKLTNELSMTSGNVTIAKSDTQAGTPLTISGGGRFKGNWNPGQWNMYFNMEVSVDPATVGTWDGQNGMVADNLSQDFISGKRLGAFMTFDVPQDEDLVVYVKIAISMESVDNAKKFMAEEIPGWDFEAVKADLLDAWNETLSAVQLGENETEETKRRFYTALYHTNIHPRDKTDDTGEWDDFYTIWDMWKSEFPLLSITRTDVIKGHLKSLISRSKSNAADGSSYNNVEWKGETYGTVSDAYIQGVEYYAGQSGSEIDCVIGDAFLKFYNDESFSDVDWEALYGVLLANAGHRTPSYLTLGYQASDASKSPYSSRLYPTSATLGFSYDDYCVAQAAKLLGYTEDYEKFMARSRNYLNLWDETATSDGFYGFFRNKNSSGVFGTTDPKAGYNTDLYEADIWEGVFMPVYDVEKLVELMGGKGAFVNRLSHALESGYINFGNEPSFQTPWLASTEQVRRPDLTTAYAQKFLNRYSSTQYPGDEDNGAMSSSYIFLNAGFYPFSGTNNYYIHGPRVSEVTFNLANGKTFKVTADNAGGDNIYVQSATFNGEEYNNPYFTYEMMSEGGELHFVMGSEPSMWARVPDNEAPTDVTNVAVDESAKADGIISLTWDEATDNEGLDEYLIYRGTTADFEISDENLLATTDETSFKMLMATGTYYFKIYAKDMAGNISANPGLSGEVVLSTEDIVVITNDYNNLALNKDVTASAFVKEAEGPAYAVDGNTGTKWCDNTSSEFWLEVDLGATYQISKWVVAHAGVKENARLNTRDFSLQILTEAGWVDVDTVEGNTETTTTRLLENPVNARYVRLYITGAQDPNAVADGIAGKVAARIYEFELYSYDKAPDYSYSDEDVAYTDSITYALKDKMVITSSEAVNASETADKVFDANTNTKFSGKTDEKWIAVDLGEKYIVDKFVLLSSGTENVTYITKDFILQYKDDEGNWVDAATVTGNSVDNAVIELANPVTAQQFRLWVVTPVQDNFDGYTRSARIREWHLYGESAVPPIEEQYDWDFANSITYALRDTMTIDSCVPYKEAEAAQYVFDNNTSTKFSSADTDKWISVDFGAKYTVDRFVLLNCGNESATYITRDFELLYMDDNGEWQTAKAITENTTDKVYVVLDAPVTSSAFKLHVTTPVQPDFNGKTRSTRIREFHLFGEKFVPNIAHSITYAMREKMGITSSTAYKETESAKYAFDNSTNTKFSSIADGDKWIAVDLGENYVVSEWILVSAGDERETNITYDFSLQYLDENDEWQTAQAVKGNRDNIAVLTLETPVTAQQFRLWIDTPVQPEFTSGSRTARILEWHLFGTREKDLMLKESITYKNFDKLTVEASGWVNENELPINVFDADATTKWTVRNGVGQWITVDLGGVYKVDQMMLLNSGNEKASYITKGFKLQVWQNDEWVDALTVTDNAADEVYFDVEPVVGQLFRAYFTAPVQDGETNNSVRLREFHLFGEEYTVAELISIEVIDPVTAANGAKKTAEGLKLPNTVAITTDGGEKLANVVWDVENCEYVPETIAEQKFTVNGTVELPEDVVNDNAVSLDVAVDVTVSAAEFELTADANAYTPSSIITLKATVPNYIAKIGIANENGKYISTISRTSAPSEKAGYTEWTVTLSVATVGQRVLSLCVNDENMNQVNTGASVEFIVAKVLPSGTDTVKVNSVRTQESVKANEVFTVTVKTSKSVTNVGIFSKAGNALGKVSQTYVDNDDERIWTISTKIGSKGSRSFDVKAKGLDTEWSEAVSFDIVVY